MVEEGAKAEAPAMATEDGELHDDYVVGVIDSSVTVRHLQSDP